MAVTLKSRNEIAQLREAGRIVAETYEPPQAALEEKNSYAG